jgi:uncharacterized protein with PIN domain
MGGTIMEGLDEKQTIEIKNDEGKPIQVTIDPKQYGANFKKVCPDCQEKLAKEFLEIPKYKIALNPLKFAKHMSTLLCPTCKKQVVAEMKDKGLL